MKALGGALIAVAVAVYGAGLLSGWSLVVSLALALALAGGGGALLYLGFKDKPDEAEPRPGPVAKFVRASFSHPMIAALLAIAAPLAGLLVAARGPLIVKWAESWPFLEGEIFAIPSAVFYFLVCLSVVMVTFTAHKWAEASKSKETHDKLDEEIQVVATLGLKRAADEFAVGVRESYLALLVNGFAEPPDADALGDSIRAVLIRIAKFAAALDAVSPADYSCSLFVYYEMEDYTAFSEQRQRELQSKLALARHETDPQLLAGYLQRLAKLSVSGQQIEASSAPSGGGGGAKPDPADAVLPENAASAPEGGHGAVQAQHGEPGEAKGAPPAQGAQSNASAGSAGAATDIVLPVRAAPYSAATGDNRRQRFKVLPGAPYSVLTGQHGIFQTRAQLETWCKDADYDDQTRENIYEFFSQGTGVGIMSFVTFPLYANETPEKIIGAISIERAGEGILQGRREVAFVQLWTPFQLMLSQLLSRYIQVTKLI
jgi:hypothetical protein